MRYKALRYREGVYAVIYRPTNLQDLVGNLRVHSLQQFQPLDLVTPGFPKSHAGHL